MLWWFLPFVVVLSGVVAYAADTIARKAGRKHLRWFGLRPKTTALIVAVLSGMGISAASLGAFVALNRSAITTIAAADQVRPALEKAKLDLTLVQDDLKSAQSDRDAAQAEAQKLAALQEQAATELGRTREDLKAARAAEAKLEGQTQTLQASVKTLSATTKGLEQRAKDNRVKLDQSEQALKASRERAQVLDAEVSRLKTQSALSALEVQAAQNRAEAAQKQADQVQVQARAAQERARVAQAQAAEKTKAAQVQVGALSAQVAGLRQSRQEAEDALSSAQRARQAAEQQRQAAQQARDRLAQDRDRLSADRDKLLTERAALTADRDRLAQERDKLLAERTRLAAERTKLTAERDRLALERDRLASDRDRAKGDLNTLQIQQQQLKSSNEKLARDLSLTRASLGKLQDEYSSSRAELSASLNTDLAFPKNDLVYAAVVPSVRNLDKFLQDAASAARAKGAKGTPAARLSGPALSDLETKLRGLNVTTFVQCRAAQNAVLGLPVDLSCDARPNSTLYRGNEVIRRVNVNLKADPRVIQEQISDLIKDTVVDITRRGVPDEYIMNQGLDVNEFVNLLARLNDRSDQAATAVVGLAARSDVKPSTRVDLYPVLP